MTMSGIASSIISFFKRPLVLVILGGLFIRLVLMPLLTYDFDIYHWALIISNMNSGNDLYGLDGYYYTPVWGYILGTISAVQEALVDIGPMGMRFTDILGIEGLDYKFHIATITSIAFNMTIKIPMIICDLAVGYLIYYLVKERTGSTKKATYGFALWFLCPIVIYMSAVQGMFDTISALLLLLTVIMLYKDHCFLAGAFLSMAVLLKFFPGFCIFVFIAYILVKHRHDGLAKKKLFAALAGFLVMFAILMMPAIINGNLADALTFISGRMSETLKMLFTLGNAAFAALVAIFFGYKMYRTPSEKADDTMFVYVLITIAASTLISITPQYVIVVIPFLILYLLKEDRSYIRIWALMGVSAFLGAFILNNFSLLASLSEYTSFVSPEWVISCMQTLEKGIFGINLVGLFTQIANMLQYISVWLVFIFYYADAIGERYPKIGGLIMRIKGKGAENSES